MIREWELSGYIQGHFSFRRSGRASFGVGMGVLTHRRRAECQGLVTRDLKIGQDELGCELPRVLLQSTVVQLDVNEPSFVQANGCLILTLLTGSGGAICIRIS